MEARSATEFVSPEELRALTRRSDLAGLWGIASTWAVIAGTFAALVRWPHPATFLLAVVVLGGRQLALAILMHEAAHWTLFRTRALNDRLTQWLCAWPLWNDLPRYRRHHLNHHKYTGTERDPDLSLAPVSPMSRRSLARKVVRDLSGVAGLRRLLGQALIASELIEYSVGGEVVRGARGRGFRYHLRAGLRNSAGFVLTNLALAGALSLLGHLWVYWAWAIAYLTTFSLFFRVRSLSEHACTERSADPLRNTRTTHANWLARATVAPIGVNYHLEHHLLVAVPWFRLRALHTLLRERAGVQPAPGYFAMLGLVSRPGGARR